jgi:hypothetical protein
VGVKFSAGYDRSKTPELTTHTTTTQGGYVDPRAVAAAVDTLGVWQSAEGRATLKSAGWTDDRIDKSVGELRRQIENSARQIHYDTSVDGVRIPVHATANFGGRTSLGLGGGIGIGSYGMRFDNPTLNVHHTLKGGQNIGLNLSPDSVGLGFQSSWGKSSEDRAREREKDNGNKEGIAVAIAALVAFVWDKIGTKYRNDQIHGELQKNPPPIIKRAWEIGLKNLSDDDIYGLVSTVEKTREEILKKTKDKKNGAYHFFSQELKHFYAERIRRAQRKWATAYVKNWAEGKEPEYENYLRDRLNEDFETPEVQKHIGQPHWNNPNDWRMVDKAGDWIRSWGETPNRLDTYYRNFSDEKNRQETERKESTLKIFNQKLAEFSKGQPEGFSDYLRNHFDIESLDTATPSQVAEVMDNLSESGKLNDIIGNFHVKQANDVFAAKKAKEDFRDLQIDRMARGFPTDDPDLIEHIKGEIGKFIQRKWTYPVDTYLGDSASYDRVNRILHQQGFFDKFRKSFEEKKRQEEERQREAQPLPTVTPPPPVDEQRMENEINGSSPTMTPIPLIPQQANESDVDLERHENEMSGSRWSSWNPSTLFSSYFNRNNFAYDADLHRLSNEYQGIVPNYTVPKYTPPSRYENLPTDTPQQQLTKARMRLIEESKKLRPEKHEKLTVKRYNDNPLGDAINILYPDRH